MNKILYLYFLLISIPLLTHAQSSDYLRADSLYEKENFEEALRQYTCISESASQNTADGMKLYVASQTKAALCCHQLNMGKKGMDICRPLLKLSLSEDQRHKLYEAYTLNGLSIVYEVLSSDTSDFTEVRALISDIKPYAEGSLLDTLLKRLQYTYIIEGYGYLNSLRYQKAYECLSPALNISSDAYQRVFVAKGIAEALEEIGTYDQMLEAYGTLGEIAKNNGYEDFFYRSLMSRCNICRKFNDMERYAKLGASLDSLISRTTDSKALCNYYKDLGADLMSLGDYATSELYFKRFHENAELEEDSVSRTNLASNYNSYMRDLMREQGRNKEALNYNEKLIKWYADKYSCDNYTRYIPYLIESQIYVDLKDSVNFERCCDTLFIADRLMPSAYLRSFVYHFRGSGYFAFGNYAKSLDNYNKADSLLATEYPETSDVRMKLMQFRAGVLEKMNRVSEAFEVSKRYQELCKTVYGENSEMYSVAVASLAEIKSIMGEMNESAHLYSYSISIMNDILHQQLRYVPATYREVFIKGFTKRLWKMSSLALDFKEVDRSFIKQCYNTILTLKSLVFESDRSMYNTLQAEGTPEEVEDFINMSVIRSRMESLYKDYENNKAKIDSTRNILYELDNKLTLKSQAYKDYTSFLDYTYEDVCSHLGRKDVLFDYFDYDTPDGDRQYVVYVIKKNNRTPVIVDAFLKSEVDSLIGSDADYSVIYSNQVCDKTTAVLWNKLCKYATEGANVYYVPSGLMYQVALESIPLSDGSLLGEHYNFVRLTSAYELKHRSNVLQGNKNAVLYGGLKYDMDNKEMYAESRKFGITNMLSMRTGAGGSTKFEYLAGSLFETDEICRILRSKGYDVKYYSETEGTEESFIMLHNNAPEILHIATHGFYYTPDEAVDNMYLRGSSNAMHLSGLVFSGGNAAWLGKKLPDGVLGGILSASNISCMDLSDVSIAVLSACQSGQGKVTRDGLFGLQRAFKKAGVKTIVMTLWNVSDKVTSEFMVEFYKNLFKGNRKTDKKKAFMKAKRMIRNKYPEPVYWAGFMMVD